MNQPNPIHERLAQADRVAQKERGGSLLLRAVKWLLGALLLAFALDVLLHLGPGARLAAMGLLVLAAAGLGGWSYYVACVRRSQLERIARFLEERDPALGSKLINILQLQAETENEKLPPLTRQLARLAIADYAGQLQSVDFAALARSTRLKLEFKRAAWACAACAAVLAAFWQISAVELARFADPFGDHPPYSFTQLEIAEPGPAGAKVVYGQGVIVRVKHAGHRPGDLYLTFHPPAHPEQAVTVPMFTKGDAGFAQQIEGIHSDLVLYAHTKNRHSYSKKRQVAVILTPKLDKAFVQIGPPAYTGIKPEERPYQFKSVSALTNSAVRFRLQSNRPLRDGVLEIIRSETDVEKVPLTRSGTNEVSGTFAARDSARLRFTMTDVDGIPSQDTWEGALAVTHDLPPEITITNPQKDCFVSLDFKLAAELNASDDYGLRMIRIHRALNQVYSAPKLITYAGIVRNARETFDFDFQQLGVKSGDVISFFAEAIDTAPEPNLARSQTINLTIITEDEYNSFLREQSDIGDIEAKYAELLEQFHDLVEEQRKLGEAIADLQKKLAKSDPKQKENLQRELDGLLAKQNELNQKLNKMADRMENFVRKNPVYDVETELQENLRREAEQIRESTKENDAASKDVAQRSAPQTGPRQMSPDLLQDFKQASDEQLKKLGGVEQQAQKDVEGTLQDMAAMHELVKDFNRFKELFDAQQALTEQARAYNRAGPLSREDQLALKDLASTERQVAEELERLGEKLREDAKKAEKTFPKAAESARDLAEKMDDARMSPLARQATDSMLAGKGENGFQLSERLRGEMEKLFGECQSKGGEMGNEMDQQLRLTRGMNPGQSFKQMQQSRKFGGNKPGQGFMSGRGDGQGGEGGYVVMQQPTIDVVGGETRIQRSDSTRSAQGQPGLGKGLPDDGKGVNLDKSDVVKNLKPVNRKSEAVTSESMVEEYRDIVEKYFRQIAK